MKKRVFSGIQPTGIVHLGNYIGALKNWVAMQEHYDCLYCIVDLHAITIPQEPAALHDQILTTAAITLAVGIDPKTSLLFVQSDVPEHGELAWILNAFVYYGELTRMTQFKDKSAARGEGTSAGLFTYPVLMAADILLYGTHMVPVGDDQRQHLELTRLIARRIEKRFPKLVEMPEGFIGKRGARIMGLDDPTVKMSKSASSAANYIAFSDTPEEIRKKIKRAVTDSGTDIAYDEEKRPAVANLLNIFSACSSRSVEEIVEAYRGKGYGDFKKDLADVVVEAVAPVQKRIEEIKADRGYVEAILKEGAERARAIATPRMAEIRRSLGLGR
jgi:tryptophanyl-tRNA synthetase